MLRELSATRSRGGIADSAGTSSGDTVLDVQTFTLGRI